MSAAKLARAKAGLPTRKAPSPVASRTRVALPSAGMQLHTAEGARKYLTAGERDAFLRAAEHADRQQRTLCMTLAYSGCRLSEALALTLERVDLASSTLVFESLKKRRTGLYRAVPVPPAPLEALDLVHGVREAQGRRGRGRDVRLWPRSEEHTSELQSR